MDSQPNHEPEQAERDIRALDSLIHHPGWIRLCEMVREEASDLAGQALLLVAEPSGRPFADAAQMAQCLAVKATTLCLLSSLPEVFIRTIQETLDHAIETRDFDAARAEMARLGIPIVPGANT